MKYIAHLTEAERITLEELMKKHPQARVRTRAHAILLSDRRYKLNLIADIYQVDRDTVSSWLAAWENLGLMGLYDDPRSGRPSKLTPEEIAQAQALLQEDPRSIKRVAAHLQRLFDKVVSLDTLKRLARKWQLVWKRIRKSLKSKRDETAFQQAKSEIIHLKQEQQDGQIELYFFDESGFSLEPLIPYAWQPKGKTLAITPTKSQRLNVLGFLSVTNNFFSFVFQGRVDTHVVIACFEAFSQTLTKPTWIILDNAPQHTAHAFKAHLTEWEQRGLHLKYLPAYSPELNLIEILWRFIKYTWLPFSAYLNFASLKTALETVLEHVGTKYQITFA